jgi:hypothetical protein
MGAEPQSRTKDDVKGYTMVMLVLSREGAIDEWSGTA